MVRAQPTLARNSSKRRAVKRLAQHQQRPLLPDDVEGVLDRAVAHPQFLKAGRPGLLDVNQSPAQSFERSAGV
jgi:hypothetical protein